MINPRKAIKNGSTTPKIILIGLSLLSFGYFIGGLTVYKKFFPFEQVAKAKSLLLGEPKTFNGLEEVNTQYPDRRTQYTIFTPKADFVMLGDSITQYGAWEDIFPTTNIRNRGIGKDKTNDLILRLGSVFALNPKGIFLMAGTNDLSYGYSTEEIMRNFRIITQKIRDNNIEPIIQSTLECSRSSCGDKLQKIRALNESLKKYAEEENIRFIDINSGLTTEQDGLLRDYTYDGTHLLGSGYAIWGKNIKPYIKLN